MSIVSLAKKFQIKLAQTTDPNMAYLQRAAETALLNLSAGLPMSAKVYMFQGKYDVQVKGLSNPKLQAAFKNNLDRAVSSQQPLLVDSYIISYQQ